jgi:copper(I)-binding protein
MKRYGLALIAALAAAAPALAQVSVTAPWIRATVPAQKSTGAYMHLMAGSDVRLVGVSSPIASVVELHKMDMDGTTMKMRQVDSIALPAGRGVNLASGGYHIMLVGLKQRLKDGDAVPLTLQIEYANQQRTREQVTLRVPVKPVSFVSPQHAGH